MMWKNRRRWNFKLTLLLTAAILFAQILPVTAVEIPAETKIVENSQNVHQEEEKDAPEIEETSGQEPIPDIVTELEEESIENVEIEETTEEELQKELQEQIEQQQEILHEEQDAALEEAEPLNIGTAERVITGFVPWEEGESEVETESKKSIEELAEKLGAAISVCLDGSDTAVEIPVSWNSEAGYEGVENGIYYFTPVWNTAEYAIAENVTEIPAKMVRVLDEIYSIPELSYQPIDELSPVSSVTADSDYDGVRLYANLEERYNPLDAGVDVLPEIRNQNPYGACWSFSSLAMGEIKERINGNSRDLSELHLVYFSYHTVEDPLGGTKGDSNGCKGANFMNVGGNLFFSQNILAGWTGAADEGTAPYGNAGSAIASGLNPGMAYNDVMHLQGAYRLSRSNDAELVKEYIKKNGSVGMSYGHYSDAQFYNESNSAYYCDQNTYPNHAVTIVGWDDNFPAENFTIHPPDNGAWLVRNSWGGSGYNKYAYFWLSYYDRTLDDEVYAFEFEDTNNYDYNYQYDGAMYTSYLSFRKTVRTANIFTPQVGDGKGEMLKAVSFTAGSTNTDYMVEIYTDISDVSNPESGNLVTEAVVSGRTTAEGYYTVSLPQSVALEQGVPFAVVITLSKDSGNPLMGTEKSVAGSWYQSTASAERNQSFVYYEDRWMDYGAEYNRNMRIKAFTDEVEGIPISEITLDASAKKIDMGESFILNKQVQPSNAIGYKIVWSSSDESVAVVSQTGMVRGVGAGEAVITAQAGGKSASCKVNVRFPFSDVDVIKGNWKYESVRYVNNNGMMGAITGTDRFMPDRTLSRAMFVTVLYRTEGEPYVGWESKFSDVGYGKWYSDAVIWASDNNIVSGFGDGSFGVDENITREQITKMLYIYAQKKGYDVSADGNLADYTDAEQVNWWAVDYMRWAVGTGLISGKPNGDGSSRLDPKGDATRAECAAILKRFADKYTKG